MGLIWIEMLQLKGLYTILGTSRYRGIFVHSRSRLETAIFGFLLHRMLSSNHSEAMKLKKKSLRFFV